ncbi:hypothetical protein, partial [Candidatus Magnetaquicoccus inordinatus]|uniref:hypothetical protein n=1 Tax=Candidatus Magnetaquicoccus inordinatus TaxID=2496818 RepID=UPI001D0EE8D7
MPAQQHKGVHPTAMRIATDRKETNKRAISLQEEQSIAAEARRHKKKFPCVGSDFFPWQSHLQIRKLLWRSRRRLSPPGGCRAKP